jgi:hypothetical protein
MVPDLVSKVNHGSFVKPLLLFAVETAHHVDAFAAVHEEVLSIFLQDHDLRIHEPTFARQIEVLSVSISDIEERSLSFVVELVIVSPM